ncbi:MAG: hypothetical protein H8E47_12740, partial [Anaerolineales bacterium]|nr:hypothetical protein [Anaerolineales bacterium]
LDDETQEAFLRWTGQPNSKPPRSKLRGIPSGMIVLGAAAPKPPLAIPPRSKLGGILATLVNRSHNEV